MSFVQDKSSQLANEGMRMPNGNLANPLPMMTDLSSKVSMSRWSFLFLCSSLNYNLAEANIQIVVTAWMSNRHAARALPFNLVDFRLEIEQSYFIRQYCAIIHETAYHLKRPYCVLKAVSDGTHASYMASLAWTRYTCFLPSWWLYKLSLNLIRSSLEWRPLLISFCGKYYWERKSYWTHQELFLQRFDQEIWEIANW